MSTHIDIVFDGPPGNESGRFVEVEDGAGHGIAFGEWFQRADGLWALRIPDLREAARAAAAYLAAHAALVAAGVSEERPAAARRLADAWIALTGACAELPAGGPEQDRGAAALRPAGHAFVPRLWGKDCCDAKVDEDGRSRTCTKPRRDHEAARKHWPDCALNHGGSVCDMGPECGTDAEPER